MSKKKEIGKVIHELGNKIQEIGGLLYLKKPHEEVLQSYIDSVGVFRKLVDTIEQSNIQD